MRNCCLVYGAHELRSWLEICVSYTFKALWGMRSVWGGGRELTADAPPVVTEFRAHPPARRAQLFGYTFGWFFSS